MSAVLSSTRVAGEPEDLGRGREVKLETLIDRLVAKQAHGTVGYWAAFTDERGVGHYAFMTDPAYADLSPENGASRTKALAAFSRAIERYRAALVALQRMP